MRLSVSLRTRGDQLSATNLTREDAQRRAALLEVESYAVELDLTNGIGGPGEGTFPSSTTVRFRSRQAGASSWIDLIADAAPRAELNGKPIDLSGYRAEEGIPLTGLAERNELTVAADCRYMNTGEGLHRFVDPVDKEVYLY